MLRGLQARTLLAGHPVFPKLTVLPKPVPSETPLSVLKNTMDLHTQTAATDLAGARPPALAAVLGSFLRSELGPRVALLLHACPGVPESSSPSTRTLSVQRYFSCCNAGF